MTKKYQHLFSPIKIGNVEVKNRFAMMPMGVFSPRLMNPDGSYSKDGADYYIERAKGVFFQAEAGIRDWSVTGVQTCALPI